MAKLMEDLKALTAEVQEVAEILTEDNKLKKAIENLTLITTDLRTVINENSPQFERGVKSLSRSAEHMDAFLERNSERLDSMVVSLETVSKELPELFERIGGVTDAIGDLTKRLESDDSTLGALIQDRELLDKLEKAILSLDELVNDIKANPKRYLKVEIF
jgi:phospholipid/cholesterol/gamma-HCH transport system substrate-binding protein